MDGGFGKGGSQIGLRTTVAVKKVGCSNLKSLIEEDKLIIEDFDTVNELTSFVAKRQSYEADDGHHDDLVMTLVLFAWITTQTYFQELLNVDIRKTLYEGQLEQLEEEMTPFGFINSGQEPNTEVDSEGNVWHVVDDENDYYKF